MINEKYVVKSNRHFPRRAERVARVTLCWTHNKITKDSNSAGAHKDYSCKPVLRWRARYLVDNARSTSL